MELNQIIRLAYLLSHRFTDTLSVAEKIELEEWLAADEQNRLLAEELKRRNFYSDKQIEEHLYDCMAAFQKVQARQRRYAYRKRMRRIYWGVAALLILMIGGTFFKLFFPSADEISQLQEFQLSAGESRAVLTLANGQKLELTQQMSDSVIAANGVWVDATAGRVEYKQNEVQDTSVIFNMLEVPRKGEYRLQLSDGTEVWMNSDSRIKYPVVFTGKERRVFLEGEAYFEVAKDEKIPFIVDMGKASIRVLGTSFNARAYRDENSIYATLAEGRIQLNAGRENLVLQPEEQGVVELFSGKLMRKKVEVNLYCGWKEGRFIFQEQTMEEIMNTLARWYDIQVFFENSAVRQVTFTGNLKRYDSFNQIIKFLEMTETVHFKVNGNSVLISE